MAKKQDLKYEDLVTIKPITDNQKVVFKEYAKGQNLFLHGAAGTGKTFVSFFLALQEVLNPETPYETLYIVRSAVPTREIGFLPGDEEDKTALYQVPYQNMVQFMFKQPSDQAFNMLYDRLKSQGSIMFLTTSYLRGISLDYCIVLVDECQNLNFHELDTVMTRIGQDSKIIFSGDFFQTDLRQNGERDGMVSFMDILMDMEEVSNIEFNIGDIVRSGLVRSYLIAKTKKGIEV